MPGNDLTSLRNIIPAASDTRATARANITTILTGILNDIEPKVTPAGLDITSALSFLSGGTYQAATDLGFLNMQDRTDNPGTNESVFVKNDELWFIDGSGTAVQITSGGSVAGAAGNVTGSGYGTGGVEVNWDSGTAEYRMKAGAGASNLADVVMDKARFDDGAATFATLGAPGSMAATLAFLLPGTHPGSTALMTLSSAGAMGHTRDPSVDSVTVTNDYKHGSYSLYLSAAGGISSGGTPAVGASTGEVTLGGSGTSFVIPIPLKAGDRITAIHAYAFGGDTATKTVSLETKLTCDGTNSTLDSSNTSASSGAITISMTGITHTINTTTTSNAVFFKFAAAHANDRLLGIRVVYDRA